MAPKPFRKTSHVTSHASVTAEYMYFCEIGSQTFQQNALTQYINYHDNKQAPNSLKPYYTREISFIYTEHIKLNFFKFNLWQAAVHEYEN